MTKRKKRSRIINTPVKDVAPIDTAKTIDRDKYLPGLYDTSNSRLAKDHYMTYLMRPVNSKHDCNFARFYLSKSNKKEFNLKKTTQKRYLLDEYPNYKFFIEDCLVKVFGHQLPEKGKYWHGKDFLAGLGCFLDYLALDSTNNEINHIEDIDEQIQLQFYDYAEMKPMGQAELMYSARFFSYIARFTGKFNAQYRAHQCINITPAYPSTVIYKLDYYARQSIEENIALYHTYCDAIEEGKELGKIFTLENLLKTLYSKEYKQRNPFFTSLTHLIKKKYGINAQPWNTKNGKIYYKNKKAKQLHMDLIKIAEKGIDIMPNTLALKLLWFFMIFPNWPYNTQRDPEYDNIFNKEYRKTLDIIGLKMKETIFYFRPPGEAIYPLLLLLQIRTGKNTQPLVDLKIEKTTSGKYNLGLRLDDGGRKIYSVKSRTNTEDYIFLHSDKEINRYIETFLEWFGCMIYKNSEYKNFFQGVNSRSKGLKTVTPFNSGKRSVASENFLRKYKIIDNNTNQRLESINHMRLRPSFVGASYLRGLKEYKIQHILRHNNVSTQHLHYSNHVESKEHKMRRIAWAQRKITELFKGQIIKIGDKELELGRGILADCEDATSPTHEQKPKLINTQKCKDWTMCLLCEKSRVIKELHGPVIIAMKLYLEELNETMTTRDWEKEFREIYDSTLSALENFTDKEKLSLEEKALTHRTLCEATIIIFRQERTTKNEDWT